MFSGLCRKAISEIFLFHYFLDIYVSVVCEILFILKDKSNGDDDNDDNDDDDVDKDDN